MFGSVCLSDVDFVVGLVEILIVVVYICCEKYVVGIVVEEFCFCF